MQELQCTSAELNIEVCLLNGQSFRFEKIETDTEYSLIRGIARDRLWQFQRIGEKTIGYTVLGRFNGAVESEDHSTLHDYFQLDVDLLSLYKQWSNDDVNFKEQLEKNFQHLSGVRVLKQDLLETFFAFMCSSNNNIKRIQSMVNELARLYGERISVEIDDELQEFYNFPTLEQMYSGLDGMEAILKEKKFGYRAPWISNAIRKLHELGGLQWLNNLKSLSYKEANSSLISNFKGIGKKVADCICLMTLCFNETVPIDTHVFNISSTKYLKSDLPKEYSKLNAKHVEKIQEFWKDRFGDYAGWAQSTLFTNQLQAFKQEPKKKATKRKKT